MKKEYVVYTGKNTLKTFYQKAEAIRYAKKNDWEVWQDTITPGGMIVDSVKIYPDTGEQRKAK